MLGLQFSSVKEIARQLFLTERFDCFWLSEARFVTEFTTLIDGRRTAEEAEAPYADWARIRPLALDLIKGKALPQSFSLVFAYPHEKTAALLAAASVSAGDAPLPGLFLNLRYTDRQMTLTTGIGTADFALQRALQPLWDRTVLNLLGAFGLDGFISQP